MVKTSSRRVPFTGVDGVMHGLDEPRRPQTIELEVAVEDRLVDQRVRDAVATAVTRHPMARARQAPARPFDPNYVWEIDGGSGADPVEVRTTRDATDIEGVRDTFISKHIELDVAPPFRVMVVHEEAGDRVMLSVNHAAFDGIGAIRLLQSISRAYAGQEDPLPGVDPIEVRGLLDGRNRGRTPRRPGAAARSSLAVPQRPARLASSGSGGSSGFGILHLDLDVADATPPPGATVNDALVAALHLAVEQWNRSKGAPCGQVSTMVPVNQRPEAWRGEVLVNLVLSAKVVSSPADRARPRRLLEAVAEQTRAVKVDGVGAVADAARTSPTPVFLRRLLPHAIDAVADWTADTAVLSNLGRVDDPPWFGGQGRGLWFSPPPRQPVILTVGAATYGNHLGISLRWCRPAFSAAAVHEFSQMFVAALDAIRSADTNG